MTPECHCRFQALYSFFTPALVFMHCHLTLLLLQFLWAVFLILISKLYKKFFLNPSSFACVQAESKNGQWLTFAHH